MKIAVCGCSFSSVSDKTHPYYEKYKNTHFSELLQKNHYVFNFAHGGVSNYYIRLQVEEAVKINPDVVILTPTNVPRLEILRKSLDNNKNLFDQISHIGNNDSRMISAQFDSALRNGDVTSREKKAVKHFMKHFYDELWETKKQTWVIRDALTQLKESKIPCLFQPWFLNVDGIEQTFNNIYGYIIPYEDSICSYKINFNKKIKDPGYHTTIESQKKFYLYLVENAFNKVNTL